MYLIASIGILTFFSGLFALYRVSVRRKSISRVMIGEHYPVICEKVMKNIKILNENGDAFVNYWFMCRNTSQKALKKFAFNYSYDGRLTKIDILVNRSKAKSTVEQLFTRKRLGERLTPIPSLPNLARVLLDLRDENIRHGDSFIYEIRLKIKDCYKQVFEKEFTSFSIVAPTKRFELSLNAPKGFKIEKKALGVIVQNRYAVTDHEEEQRIALENSPRVLSKGKRIVWDISNPKLASRYTLQFRIQRSE